MRSLLELNGILEDKEIKIPKLKDGNRRLCNAHDVTKVINDFIKDAKNNERNLGDLFQSLKSKPFGLRDGYIVVLIAAMLRKHRHNIFIRLKGIDQELGGELFDRIARYPNHYTITIDEWEEDIEEYIKLLEEKFGEYIIESTKKKNRLKALHDGMLHHYKSISKFGRTTKDYVGKYTIMYRELIEEPIKDYSDFFFNKLINLGENYKETIDIITVVKNELESTENRLIANAKRMIRDIFKLRKNKNIANQLLDLYENNWKKRAEFNLNYITSQFIRVIKNININTDDTKITQIIGKLITGFELNYWSDEQNKEFNESLKEIYGDLMPLIII